MVASTHHEIHVATEINAPAERVWELVSDHEATPTWIDQVKAVTITRDGAPVRGGLGAIRVVDFKPRLWTTIHEEITGYEANRFFEYVLFQGMPSLISHHARVGVDDLGGGRSRLTWDVRFEFARVHPFRLFLKGFLRDFEAVLAGGLANAKAQLER